MPCLPAMQRRWPQGRTRGKRGRPGTPVEWYDTVFELIDGRSFSNAWFWIVLAVLWSSVSHWVIGVPYDMISRGRRQGGQAQADVEALVAINARRFLYIGREAGLMVSAFAAFVLTVLGVLGFAYRVELAQAFFLLSFPLVFVGLLSLHAARRYEADQPQGEALHRLLFRHRLAVQGVGVVSIFVTALWGMWHNLFVSVLH